ncbi:MAG: DNA starvation/stationary phase protection protein [Bacteroidia bacterium]|nr:DNA starvation/stationary phase protection protein [Bacteroidia bacterium]
MKKKENKENRDSNLVGKLNSLLASYQVAYFNFRSSHWMIKGENFFELHKVFETAYNDATEKIDEIAERILTLGGTPLLTATEMIKRSNINENGESGKQEKCVADMLHDLKALAVIENQIVKLADEQDDVVTADQMTKYLGEQQKISWMLSQFLNKKSSIN